MSPQEKFRADQTVVELADLLPATDYSVTLYALYEEDPSDPVTAVATTCKSIPKCCFCPVPAVLFDSLDSFPSLTVILICPNEIIKVIISSLTSPHSPSSATNECSVSYGHPQHAEGELGARSQRRPRPQDHLQHQPRQRRQAGHFRKHTMCPVTKHLSCFLPCFISSFRAAHTDFNTD